MTEKQYITVGNSYLVISVSLGDPWDGYILVCITTVCEILFGALALNVVKKEYQDEKKERVEHSM